MNSLTMQRMSRNVWRELGRNSPTLLTVLGVVGGALSIVMAVKATPKALMILEAEEQYRDTEVNDPDYQRPIDTIQAIELTWKCYVPTAAMFALTAICILGSNSISMRRNAALAGLLSLAETSFYEYQQAVIEEVGEKKHKLIRGRMAQKALADNPITSDTRIYNTGGGSYLCYDRTSGRYFYSHIETIRRAENNFNQRLRKDGSLSLNDFYEEINLPPTDIGSNNGWDYEKQLMFIDYTSALKEDDKTPCLVLFHRNLPINLWS